MVFVVALIWCQLRHDWWIGTGEDFIGIVTFLPVSKLFTFAFLVWLCFKDSILPFGALLMGVGGTSYIYSVPPLFRPPLSCGRWPALSYVIYNLGQEGSLETSFPYVLRLVIIVCLPHSPKCLHSVWPCFFFQKGWYTFLTPINRILVYCLAPHFLVQNSLVPFFYIWSIFSLG